MEKETRRRWFVSVRVDQVILAVAPLIVFGSAAFFLWLFYISLVPSAQPLILQQAEAWLNAHPLVRPETVKAWLAKNVDIIAWGGLIFVILTTWDLLHIRGTLDQVKEKLDKVSGALDDLRKTIDRLE